MFGPSDRASSGFGCTSMKNPSTPAPAAAQASGSTNSRWPLGFGARRRRATARYASHRTRPDSQSCAKSGTTAYRRRDCYTRMTIHARSVRSGCCRTLRSSSRHWPFPDGDRNCPFFTFTTLPVLAAAISKIGLPAEKCGNLQHIHDLAGLRRLLLGMDVGQNWARRPAVLHLRQDREALSRDQDRETI